MRKSSNISKYVIDWQIERISVKQLKSVDMKLESVNAFYNDKRRTYDYYERVFNWGEGLLRGYKAARDINSMDKVLSFLDNLDNNKPHTNHLSNNLTISSVAQIRRYSKDMIVLYLLYKDLFKRHEKALSQGYNEKDLNIFIDNLYSVIRGGGFVNERYSMEKIHLLRSKNMAGIGQKAYKRIYY